MEKWIWGKKKYSDVDLLGWLRASDGDIEVVLITYTINTIWATLVVLPWEKLGKEVQVGVGCSCYLDISYCLLPNLLFFPRIRASEHVYLQRCGWICDTEKWENSAFILPKHDLMITRKTKYTNGNTFFYNGKICIK